LILFRKSTNKGLIILITSLKLLSNTASAQGFEPWELLYKEDQLTVEVQFKIEDASCTNSKKHKIQYRVEGTLSSFDYYLIWKTDYIDCNGKSIFQEHCLNLSSGNPLANASNEAKGDTWPSQEDEFLAESILTKFYDVITSNSPSKKTGIKINLKSILPDGIEGNSSVIYGQSTDLNVKGGILGSGANWVWYSSLSGDYPIGKGNSITVSPLDTITYLVRAEGFNNKTSFAKFIVNVDKRSIAPTGIIGNSEVCKGENTTLTVEGGSLGFGLDAEWIWYENVCNGNQIGKGNSITINPTRTTTYYVRAEGKYKTECAKFLINVKEKSLDPSSISSNQLTTICEGEKIKLLVAGGLLSDDAEWKWYESDCEGSSIASGAEVEFEPLTSTTYLVRAEGLCNKTNCVPIFINVYKKSLSPGYIEKPLIVSKNKKYTLQVIGGNLGENSEWKWFNGSCDSDKPIGSGTSIIVRTRKPTHYFVKAEGFCNETSCAEIFISPEKNHTWDHTYSSKYKKFLHLGLGLGLEFLQFSEFGNYSPTGSNNPIINDSIEFSIKGIGLKGEIPFYPFMKDYLSIGFIPSYSIGMSPSFLSSNATYNTSTNTLFEEKYFYQKSQLETELAFGFKPAKLLFKLKRSFQSNDYKITLKNIYITNYKFNSNFTKEILSAGIRLGRYARKTNYKRGSNLDFIYTLSRDPYDILAFSINDYSYLSHWKPGAGLTWWCQSAFKFQFDVTLNTIQKNLNFETVDFNDATYQISLIYNRNWFY